MPTKWEYTKDYLNTKIFARFSPAVSIPDQNQRRIYPGIKDAVVKGNNPLLLGFLGQEDFIGFLVGVGSFLLHLKMRIYDFFRDLELAQCLGTSKH